MTHASTSDRIWSVIALVVAVGGAVVGVVPALMLAMASDACSDSCNLAVLNIGWLTAVCLPPIVALSGAVVTAIRLIRGRPAAKRAWQWVLGQVATYVIGFALVFLAVGQ